MPRISAIGISEMLLNHFPLTLDESIRLPLFLGLKKQRSWIYCVNEPVYLTKFERYNQKYSGQGSFKEGADLALYTGSEGVFDL